MPASSRACSKNVSSALRPPADAPMPTTMNSSGTPGGGASTSGSFIVVADSVSRAAAARFSPKPLPVQSSTAIAAATASLPPAARSSAGRDDRVDGVGDDGIDPLNAQRGRARRIVDGPCDNVQARIAGVCNEVVREQRVLRIDRNAAEREGARYRIRIE